MSVRKNITMSDKVYADGAKRAKELFDGNFSAYLAHLVIQDTQNKGMVFRASVETEKSEKQENNIDDEVIGSVDDILDGRFS